MTKPVIVFTICLSILLPGIAQNKNTYTEVTLPELMKKLQEKDTNMVIVDVRSRGEYYDSSSRYQQSNIGHIKGAVNIPVQDFRRDPSIVHQLDAYRNKEIYVICSHSYRSRVVSNILLDSGFAHVNNTRGGMTEFFRRYNEVAPLRDGFYETNIKYNNIAPAQLLEELAGTKNPLLISISNPPAFFWDSLNLVFYKYYPSFKNAASFNYGDSLKILELVKKENRPVILFNTVNYGAAELAGWLTGKGIANAAYLVGGADLFYEYLLDQNLSPGANKYLTMNSKIHFITPVFFCNNMADSKNIKIVDLRADSLFNKITKGTKYNYTHLKNAVNFFLGKGIHDFEKEFPGKKTEYVFVAENSVDALQFVDNLAKDGYRTNWLNGGLQEWEWYMNNVETFKCMDYLVK